MPERISDEIAPLIFEPMPEDALASMPLIFEPMPESDPMIPFVMDAPAVLPAPSAARETPALIFAARPSMLGSTLTYALPTFAPEGTATTSAYEP
jgi:hypothetical protein